MAVIALLVVLGHVDDREADRDDVAVLDDHAGAFELVPVVLHAVGIADEVGAGFVGKPLHLPAGDAVARDQVEGAAIAPMVDDDVVPAAAVPDHRILIGVEPELGQPRQVAVDGFSHDLVRAEDPGLADQDLPRSLDDLVAAVGARHDADVGAAPRLGRAGLRDLGGLEHRGEGALVDDDVAELGPGSVDRCGGVDVAVAGLADHHRVAAVVHPQRGDVVALAAHVLGPHQAAIGIGAVELVAGRLHRERSHPRRVPGRLRPAAGEHPVLAVRALQDLPVPIVPALHRHVFEAVAGVARADRRGAPDGGRERRLHDRGRLEIGDERLGAEHRQIGGSDLVLRGRYRRNRGGERQRHERQQGSHHSTGHDRSSCSRNGARC